ncbi:Unconventional myosin [Seminavis robusta]|uniref:Unconventional myosin n=1 Tax=Seminavis robusta TaxID=568900 RepID=A0A9N8DBD4_9STRA|nr:Unconventional myosin [Seminavis robusta]|eukprot:Sro19_g013410.1 Unconventional myosin (1094) ;mRNA; f:60229-63638
MGKDAQPYVYIRDEEHAWVPARQLSNDGKKATVAVQKYKSEDEMMANASSTSGTKVEQKTIDLKTYPGGNLPMQNVDDGGKLGNHEDMVNLPYLHEAAILYNIKIRHNKALPYTRTGDLVVAVNPYQWIESLYTMEKRKLYAKKLVWENSETDPREHLAPHVYETSALCYKGMAFDGINQSILVSGESGAGKTETVKICMNHIASVQEGPSSAMAEMSPVVKRILDSNPLLEAFGNAKTRRNDNSSRFGKYLQLQFDGAGGVGRSVANLAGSKAEVFLLEKNRVCKHDDWERTYHIFYQLVAAPDSDKAGIWDSLKGTNNDSFKYVGKCEPMKFDGMTDAEHYLNTTKVLKFVGLSDSDVKKFYNAICVVLQLGNVTFGAAGGDADKSAVTSAGELSKLASLMGLAEPEITLALTERTMKTRDECYKVPLGPAVAKDSADALAKEVYGKIFLWVVKAINVRTSAEANYPGDAPGKKYGIIGLLDIFGFESFGVNRFEQLCINYANEKLQQKFTEDIFKAVMDEYKYEGIPLQDIKFDDNTDVLDLVESRTGLCALLNEECVRPKGSGEGFVNKVLAAHKKSPCLVPHKTDRLSFGVVHYAGLVYYEASGFVESNKDTLPTDLEDAATKCSNSIIADAFTFEKYAAAAGGTKGKPKRQKSNLMAPTVWTKYKTQLSSLMTSLYATQSKYIRCIKPNTVKKPLIMEHKTSVEQLRYAGIVAGVTISRSAFPNRLANSVVFSRYNSMWDKDKYPSKKSGGMSMPELVKADCEAVMECALKEKETKNKDGKMIKAFVCGKTKTYFRSGALEFLESQRVTGLDSQAITVQKAVRGWLVRKYQVNTGKIKQEQAERERLEELERQERLKREKAERDAKFKEAQSGFDKEMKDLQRKIANEEESGQRQIADAEENAAKMQQEVDELAARVKDAEAGNLSLQQEKDRLQLRLDTNMKTIDGLRKENKKLKKSLEKVEKQTGDLNSNNKKLTKQCDKNAELFNDTEGELQYADNVNGRLLDTLEDTKENNLKNKDEVAHRQLRYMAVAESRLELQKTMAYILNTIGDKLTDKKLHEEVFTTAHAAEAQAKVHMDALNATYGG